MVDPILWAKANVQSLVPYEPGKPIETLQRELGLTSCIKLASNENPLGPSQKVLDHIKHHDWRLALYPDGDGFVLKTAIAKHLGVEKHHVTLGDGSEEIFRFVIQAFVGQDQTVLIPEFSFSAYELISQGLGVKYKKAPLTQWHIDVEKLIAAVDDSTKVIFIANPNNPTGTYIGQEPLLHLLRSVREDILVVLDEAYYEYMTQADYPQTTSWLSEFPNLIITRTFSKVYGLAGLRIGYALSHPLVANIMNRIRAPFNTNQIGMQAAIWALEDQAHVKKVCDLNTHQWKILHDYFESQRIPMISTSANFITIELGSDALPIYQALLEKGIIVRPLRPYKLDNYLRISIGLESENQKFMEVFKTVYRRS